MEINKQFNCKDIYNNPDNYIELLTEPGYIVYRFHKIDSGWNKDNYIGDTTINLKFRLYFNGSWKGHFICYDNKCDHHLYNAMRKYGLDKFTLEIVYKGEYNYELEGHYIDYYDAYNNGYNRSRNGKKYTSIGSSKGKIRMTNGVDEIVIKPSELEYWTDLGWIRGISANHRESLRLNAFSLAGFIRITKDGREKVIDPNNLQYWESLGWVKGVSDATRIIRSEFMKLKTGDKNPFYDKNHSDKSKKLISEHHADVSGSNNPCYGKKAYHSLITDKTIFLTQEQYESYDKSEWVLGSSNKSRANNPFNKKQKYRNTVTNELVIYSVAQAANINKNNPGLLELLNSEDQLN